MNGNNKEWGDYYYQHKRPKGRTKWVLDMIHHVNHSIPSFNDIFDEETFYVFAIFVVIFSIILVIILAKCCGIKIKEHDIQLNRDWGEPKPANPFQFPWKQKKE